MKTDARSALHLAGPASLSPRKYINEGAGMPADGKKPVVPPVDEIDRLPLWLSEEI